MAVIVDLTMKLEFQKSSISDRTFNLVGVAENGKRFGCAASLSEDEAATINEAVRVIALSVARENAKEGL